MRRQSSFLHATLRIALNVCKSVPSALNLQDSIRKAIFLYRQIFLPCLTALPYYQPTLAYSFTNLSLFIRERLIHLDRLQVDFPTSQPGEMVNELHL